MLVSTDEIFERIDVTRPYYALEEVTADGDRYRAEVPIGQPLGLEAGPVSAAEAGRHMAILGSVAASRANPAPGKHMYLAYDAEMRRARGRPPAEAAALVLEAVAHPIDEGTSHATVIARTLDGQPVCSLSVYYMIVPHADFHGLFADHAVDATTAGNDDPYGTLVEPDGVELDGHRIRVDLGAIEPQSCVGHFEQLPAMPVAFLMSNVVSGCARLLTEVLEMERFALTVREGSVRADALAFTGEQVVVEAEYQGERYGTQWVYAEAWAGGDKRVGALHMKLRAKEIE